jgi:hypothetical protein
MAITTNDINFVYSGGSNNLDPTKSIGGYPSINPINLSVNNLFGYVKKEDAEIGLVDYRCFYIFNDSESSSIFNVNLYLKSQLTGVSKCQIGLSKSTDVQVLSLDQIPRSGSFQLIYDEYTTSNISWNNNYLIFQKNIENALNDLDILSGVVVQRIFTNNYQISFLGEDNYRNHSLIEVGINNLSPSNSIKIQKTAEGQPINSIAPLLATNTTIPSNVTFYETNDINNETKIFIGDLRPKDGVPVWVKRVTLGSVSNDQLNGFEFRFSGNLVKNPTTQPFSNKPCFYYE